MKKNNIWLITLYLSISFFHSSCGPSTADIDYGSSRTLEVDVDSIQQSFDVSPYIDTVNFFPLDEQFGNFIGEAYKILRTDYNYIILDKVNSKRIVVFNNFGSFVGKPVDVGRSSEDPVQVNDCWLSTDGQLRVYDFASKKIYFYNDKFELTNVFQSPYDRIFTSLTTDKDGQFVGYKGYTGYNSYKDRVEYKLAYLDEELGINDIYLPYDSKLNGALISNVNAPLQTIDNETIVSEQYSNSILSFDQSNLVEKYRISYTKNSLPDDFFSKIIIPNAALFTREELDLGLIDQLFRGYFGFSGNFRESKNYIILESFDDEGKHFYSIFDKKSYKPIAHSYSLYDSQTLTFLPPFSVSLYSSNEFSAVFPGYMLEPLLPANSRYKKLVDENVESNYVINVKFK